MFEYTACGASTSSQLMYWREEGLLSENSLVKRRGNLYVVVEGPPSEGEMAVKAVRDEFYGDSDAGRGGISLALRQSVEAANTLLSKRSGIGVSCVCATVSEWGQLSVLHAGDCHAFLFSSQDGELSKLGQRQTAEKALGRGGSAQLVEIKRVLKHKDVLTLCSGALADSLSEPEMASLIGVHRTGGPGAIAGKLVERASAKGTGGILTALVVDCEADNAGINPTLPLNLEMTLEGDLSEALGERTGEARQQPVLGLSGLGLGVPRFGGLGQVPAIAGAAAVLITVLFLSRPIFAGLIGDATPNPSNPPQSSTGSASGTAEPAKPVQAMEGTEALLAAVDATYGKAEWGDLTRRQELVSALEQLHNRTGDVKVSEKLNMARTSLIYAQHMQEVAEYWGKGETTALSTGSWAGAVETLEDLKAYALPFPLSLEQKNTAREKLYSAHINYGKALDQAKRSSEAKGQRERAEEIRAKGW